MFLRVLNFILQSGSTGKAAPSYGDTCRFKSGLCNSGASAHLGERLFYFIYGSAGRLTWAFTVKPQVRGLIYGGAGRLAWGVWAHEDILQKCSPWISRVWAQMTDLENLFPIVFSVLDRYWAQLTVCVKLFSLFFPQKGEHFLVKSRLYLNADRTWGTILSKTLAVPKKWRYFKNTWGTNHKKPLLCPNAGKQEGIGPFHPSRGQIREINYPPALASNHKPRIWTVLDKWGNREINCEWIK